MRSYAPSTSPAPGRSRWARRIAAAVAALIALPLLPTLASPLADAATTTTTSTIWSASDKPASLASVSGPYEVGLKFSTSVEGEVSGVRFYQGPGKPGTHRVGLWTDYGQGLAFSSFEADTKAGWTTVSFRKPIAVRPGTTYVVSYYSPNGY